MTYLSLASLRNRGTQERFRSLLGACVLLGSLVIAIPAASASQYNKKADVIRTVSGYCTQHSLLMDEASTLLPPKPTAQDNIDYHAAELANLQELQSLLKPLNPRPSLDGGSLAALKAVVNSDILGTQASIRAYETSKDAGNLQFALSYRNLIPTLRTLKAKFDHSGFECEYFTAFDTSNLSSIEFRHPTLLGAEALPTVPGLTKIESPQEMKDLIEAWLESYCDEVSQFAGPYFDGPDPKSEEYRITASRCIDACDRKKLSSDWGIDSAKTSIVAGYCTKSISRDMIDYAILVNEGYCYYITGHSSPGQEKLKAFNGAFAPLTPGAT